MNVLRLLLGLRLKYLWRGGGRGAKVALVFGWAILTMVALAMGATLFAALSVPKFRTRPEILHLTIFSFYFAWMYLGSLSEVFDPTRLFIYPVPTRKMFLIMSVTSLAGPATGFAIAFAAGLTAWPGTVAEKILRAGLIGAMAVHLVMFSRLVRLTFLELLTSRRWRDVMVTVSALVGIGIYYVFKFYSDEAGRLVGHALDGRWASHYLLWFPSVWLSNAVLDPLSAAGLAGLGAFALLTVLIFRAGGRMEERVFFSEPMFAHAPKKPKEAAAGRPAAPGIPRWLPPAIGAAFFKEAKTFARDPTVRYRLITNFAYVLIPIFASFAMRGQAHGVVMPALGYGLLFCELAFVLNAFGTDGAAMAHAAHFPARRWHVLMGKNLCALAVFGTLNLVALAAAAAATGRAAALPREATSNLACLLILLGAGNLVSVHFPMRLAAPGQRVGRGEEAREGCVRLIVRALVMSGVSLVVAPAAAALYVPLWLGPAWWAAAIPFALVYAGGVYAAGLALAGRELRRREEPLVAFFTAG